MRLAKAIDFTQWQQGGDIVTPEQIAEWQAAGVEKVIIGAGYHDEAVQQIQACADGGLAVEVYRYLFFDRDMVEQIEYALSIAADSGRHIGRLWLDCEDAKGIPEVSYLEKLIQQAIDAVGDMPVGVYTREQWWRSYTGNTDRFAHLPLWDTLYDQTAAMDGFHPYGGWSEAVMKQHAENVELSGRTVDMNVYWEERKE